MKKSLVINIFGGPGCGKSTLAAFIYSQLSIEGLNIELVTEFAKKKTFEKNIFAISYQPYITSNQVYYQKLAEKNYDYVITDSPSLLGIIYNTSMNKKLKNIYNNFLIEEFKQQNNLNFLIKRHNNEFQQNGRLHNLKESLKIDKQIINLLEENQIDYYTVKTDEMFFKFKSIILNRIKGINDDNYK